MNTTMSLRDSPKSFQYKLNSLGNTIFCWLECVYSRTCSLQYSFACCCSCSIQFSGVYTTTGGDDTIPTFNAKFTKLFGLLIRNCALASFFLNFTYSFYNASSEYI